MVGLLYKDYIGIKGNRMLWGLIAITLLFMVARFVFPGDMSAVAHEVWLDSNGSEATIGDVADLFLMMFPFLLVIVALMVTSMTVSSICSNDEVSKTMQYTRALPLKRNTYIASKYVFIAIFIYVWYSIEVIWVIIYNSQVGLQNSNELMNALGTFLSMFASVSLTLAAIELPFFLLLGTKKGNLVKTALMECLFFLLIAYGLFGDLSIIDRFDIELLLDWCREHTFAITVYSVLVPPISVAFYWLSYKCTVKIHEKREVTVHE